MHLPSTISRAAFRTLVAALLLSGGARTGTAQDTSATANLAASAEGQIVILTLVDGTTLIGRILEVTPTTIRFASSFGESSIPRSAVRRVQRSDATRLHDGQFWPEDPSRTRLFFAPTGRTLRKGEGYFADAYIFFPSVQAGVTDRFTLGGGMSVFPTSLDNQIFYLTPKVGVYASPTLSVSVGALVAGAKGISSESPAGLGYGVATWGGDDASLTAGAGFGFTRHSTSSLSVFMLGGETRLSRSISLVSENYYAATDRHGSLASGGVRFIGEKLSVDAALFTTGGLLVPYVAFLYKF